MGRILIIDDEPAICKGCSLSLTERDYHVITHGSGRQGLQEALNGSFDLVLLDMRLPDMDGMEILQRLGELRPDIVVVVMTGFSTVENAVEAMKAGAFDYLAKPFSDDEMHLAVAKALASKRLRDENLQLRKQLYERFEFGNIVGEDETILDIFKRIEKVAETDSTVLLTGESGTGKELFAGAIHVNSPRAQQRFVTVDCSSLSTGLLESELFGHLKGSFTDATHDKEGIFAVADRGTLFLDEVSNLSMETQSKLLRVMETHEFKPVGASLGRKTDVRVIAATNRDLSDMVNEGSFREDLYYRLNVFPIHLPALRERRSDIPRLAYHFLRFFCRQTGKRIEGFSDEALALLIDHPWPGNVRQLKNTIERLVIMAEHDDFLDSLALHKHLLDRGTPGAGEVPATLEALKAAKKAVLETTFAHIERAFLVKALRDCRGNITEAAKQVGMQRSNFSSLMKKHGVSAAESTRPAESGAG